MYCTFTLVRWAYHFLATDENVPHLYLINNEEINYSQVICQTLSLRVVHMHLPTAYTFFRYTVYS